MCSGITNMQWAVINNTILECVQGASRQCQGAIPCPFASVRPGMGHVFAELPGFCQIGDLWVSFWEFDAVAHGIVWGDADAVRCSFIDFVSWNSRIGWICICRCDSIDLCRTCSKCFLHFFLDWGADAPAAAGRIFAPQCLALSSEKIRRCPHGDGSIPINYLSSR